MFSVQLHVPSDSPLGQRAPVVQHLVATAVVSAVLSQPGYEVKEIDEIIFILEIKLLILSIVKFIGP